MAMNALIGRKGGPSAVRSLLTHTCMYAMYVCVCVCVSYGGFVRINMGASDNFNNNT